MRYISDFRRAPWARAIADEITAASRINNLPQDFDALRDLPPILDKILELIEAKDRLPELEQTLADFATKVVELTRGVEAAKGKSRADLFLDKVATTSATVTS